MNFRRLIVIIVILGAAAIVGFGIYKLASTQTSTPPTDTNGNLPNAGSQVIPQQNVNEAAGSLPPVQTSKRADSVLAYRADADGTATVVQLDGKIIKLTGTSTAPVSLSNATISGIADASFSADGKKALVLFGTAGALKASVFDVATLSWTALSGSFDDAAWAPQGYAIAALSLNAVAGKTDLSIITLGATPTIKTQAQQVVGLRARPLRVAWQQPGTVILYDRPTAYGEGTAWTVVIKTKVIAPLVRETLGMDLSWGTTPNLGLLFQGTLAQRGGSLGLIDGVGTAVAQLNFLTLPVKCSFASAAATSSSSTSSYLACAVPADNQQLASAVLPDAYYQKAFFTSDRLVVIDLTTQGIVFVGTTPNPADAVSLQLTGSNLYFINRYDNGLYMIPVR